MINKPWIEGLFEVLELAIEQYYMGVYSKFDIDRNRYYRASLINADNANELIIQSYIKYYKFEKSYRYLSNLKWIREHTDIGLIEQYKDIETKIRYHHEQRNTIYHQRYLMYMDRANVLSCIVTSINLFNILLRDDYENILQNNVKKRIFIGFINLEENIIKLCNDNNIIFNNNFIIQDIMLELLKTSHILDEISKLIMDAFTRIQILLPKTTSIEDISDSYEIEELLTKLNEVI